MKKRSKRREETSEVRGNKGKRAVRNTRSGKMSSVRREWRGEEVKTGEGERKQAGRVQDEGREGERGREELKRGEE